MNLAATESTEAQRPRTPWYLHLYFGIARWVTPAWQAALRHRLKRGKETEHSMAQKLAFNMPARPARPARPEGQLIWGHAVGVGEALALAGLFARMAPMHPNTHFLITSTARTSGEVLARNPLPERISHQFAPVDTLPAVRRFLSHWQPDVALWCELDLWPVLIRETERRGIPRLLLNVRLSPESIAKKNKLPRLYRWFFAQFNQIFVQNDASAKAVRDFGVPAERVHTTGTIKALAPALPHNAADELACRTALGERPVWLLASSHAGEESIALQAHQQVLRVLPNALLIIAPRYPQRGMEIKQLCVELQPCALRSADALDAGTPVYIADTIGEMGLWYRLATVTLMGGSFAQVGGHNPFEPLACGSAVLHGANVWNFSEVYDDLDAAGRAQQVNDANEIARAVIANLAQSSNRTHASPQTETDVLDEVAQHPIILTISECLQSVQSAQSTQMPK